MAKPQMDAIQARVEAALRHGWLWGPKGTYLLGDSIGLDIYCHDDYDLPVIKNAPADIRALLEALDNYERQRKAAIALFDERESAFMAMIDERDQRIADLETALGELWETFDTTSIELPGRTMSALAELRRVYDSV